MAVLTVFVIALRQPYLPWQHLAVLQQSDFVALGAGAAAVAWAVQQPSAPQHPQTHTQLAQAHTPVSQQKQSAAQQAQQPVVAAGEGVAFPDQNKPVVSSNAAAATEKSCVPMVSSFEFGLELSRYYIDGAHPDQASVFTGEDRCGRG